MGKYETYKEYVQLQHSWIVSKGLVECAYKCFFIISDFCIQFGNYIVMCITVAMLEKGLTGAVVCEV
jgi:hypothetical protein